MVHSLYFVIQATYSCSSYVSVLDLWLNSWYFIINYLVERILNIVAYGEYWLGADCVNVSCGSNKGSYKITNQFNYFLIVLIVIFKCNIL